MSRKIIILNYKDTSPGVIWGIAAMIIALGAGYYLVKKTLCSYNCSLRIQSDETPPRRIAPQFRKTDLDG